MTDTSPPPGGFDAAHTKAVFDAADALPPLLEAYTATAHALEVVIRGIVGRRLRRWHRSRYLVLATGHIQAAMRLHSQALNAAIIARSSAATAAARAADRVAATDPQTVIAALTEIYDKLQDSGTGTFAAIDSVNRILERVQTLLDDDANPAQEEP